MAPATRRTPATLRTARLILRCWRSEDRDAFAAINADPEVMAYFPAPLDRDGTAALIQRIEAQFDRHGAKGEGSSIGSGPA